MAELGIKPQKPYSETQKSPYNFVLMFGYTSETESD